MNRNIALPNPMNRVMRPGDRVSSSAAAAAASRLNHFCSIGGARVATCSVDRPSSCGTSAAAMPRLGHLRSIGGARAATHPSGPSIAAATAAVPRLNPVPRLNHICSIGGARVATQPVKLFHGSVGGGCVATQPPLQHRRRQSSDVSRRSRLLRSIAARFPHWEVWTLEHNLLPKNSVFEEGGCAAEPWR